MKTQEIGQSGMIASRVALGVMRMDALDAADAARTVAVAHDSGIDYFGLRVKMCVWLGVSRGLDLAFLNAD